MTADFGKGLVEIGAAVERDQVPRFPRIRGVAQQEADFDAGARRQHQAGAHRRARVEARAETVRQGGAAGQSRRIAERPVAADEFAAVAGPVRLAPAEIGEGDARRQNPRSSGFARKSRRIANPARS